MPHPAHLARHSHPQASQAASGNPPLESDDWASQFVILDEAKQPADPARILELKQRPGVCVCGCGMLALGQHLSGWGEEEHASWSSRGAWG